MIQTEIERWRYPRFFTDNISENIIIIGEDAKHIKKVLRMRVGDKAVICSNFIDYFSEITEIEDCVVFKILNKQKNCAEPSVYLRLFQAMPKSDKMEFIVQKAVELGACEVIPFITKRCVSRPDEKSADSKIQRYNRISYEAAKQCGRGFVPKVSEIKTFSQIINLFNEKNTGIIFYECGGEPVNQTLVNHSNNIDIIIGSEGGFEPDEVAQIISKGFKAASLGSRILRCETAPVAAISVIMNLTGNLQ